jgi:hypothetical protein
MSSQSISNIRLYQNLLQNYTENLNSYFVFYKLLQVESDLIFAD